MKLGISKKLGVDIRGKPRKLNSSMLKWRDLIIIIADDVQANQIKNYRKHKILVWKIKDVDNARDVKKAIEQTVKKIIKRVNAFNDKLKGVKMNKEEQEARRTYNKVAENYHYFRTEKYPGGWFYNEMLEMPAVFELLEM